MLVTIWNVYKLYFNTTACTVIDWLICSFCDAVCWVCHGNSIWA